jgi:hypothetical protein
MSDELIDFTWRVHQNGYRWIDADDIPREPTQPVLTSGVPFNQAADLRRYTPLHSEPALYSRFAQIPAKKEAIVGFANRYGLLGIGVPIAVEGSLVGDGERFTDWRKEINTMRAALSLWSEIVGEARRARRLEGRRARRRVSEEWLRERRQRLQRAVNQRLRDHAAPRLLWQTADRSNLGLYIVPSSLLGALWLQLARAVEKGRARRRCKACKGWIELTRTDREYCGPACRVAAQRRREGQGRRQRTG